MSFVDYFNSAIKDVVERVEGASLFRPRYVDLERFIPSNDEELDKREDWVEEEGLQLESSDVDVEPLALNPDMAGMDLVAVDSTSFKLGETDVGLLAAYRATMVLRRSDSTSIYRFGPYVFHITEGNKDELYTHFRRLLGVSSPAKAPSLHKMVDRVRNFIERFLQRCSASAIDGGLVLWDGSLTSGTVDTPREVLAESLKLARSRSNVVIAVSKHSSLTTVDGVKLISILEDFYEPCFADVHKLISQSVRSRCLGRVTVAKLSPYGFTFRVDVAPPQGLGVREALQALISSCSIHNGYPEPLRQAHAMSYLTCNEVLALQAHVAEKYGLRVLRPFDVRHMILSPYW